ncbi:hypothetical protein RAMLITH_17495 [Ramlibacter sp. RBP-2]|uniref:Uncharacterized protein n=1 Tax=Ramlibacter lithotrophicus TaxID=2606681 RepID=A0A7X6DI87_9BURK|nr:hypothetical protein [Ramlibacter lithotrophicus]NKE67620.1 hypothetical protein [Ramlibacter lithotrophicus]
MALTMTRTRTQTALTTLCRLIANVHGELEFIDWAMRLGEHQAYPVLEAKKQALEKQRDALYVTLRVFDPRLDPQTIGALNEWLKPFGRKVTTGAVRRYVRANMMPARGG